MYVTTKLNKLALLFNSVGVICVALLFVSSNTAPILLEAQIQAKEFIVKIQKPNVGFINSLESAFQTPVNELFDLPQLRRIPYLDIEAIEGSDSNDLFSTAVIASHALEDPYGEEFLMSIVAIPKKTLEKLLTDDTGSFLQVLLPGHDRPSTVEKRNGTDTEPAVMITHEPSQEEVFSKFYQQFLKVDWNKEQTFIPPSVRDTLKNVQQVLDRPKAFLHTPEGQANAEERVFTITSATPVEMLFGLFERVN